ncbi:hypothetical protein AMTRI_Chr11g98600 [Amborella trichopoda]
MEKRSWLWKRKSSDKTPADTESSGSLSSHSERFSDEQKQEVLRPSPFHAQTKDEGHETNESVKALSEKLSAALLNISAKEDLVNQHAKVAEEAVSGWEKAENEAATLKQQLDAATLQNSALEERVSHLDGALKECVRQLRQAREEREQAIHEAVIKKTRDLDLTKFELEAQIAHLKSQLSRTEPSPNANPSLQAKLDQAERDRDLSTQAAEMASKQHLESIKKVARLEAECRRLRAQVHKASWAPQVSSPKVGVESIADSYSESNDGEPSASGSWASALIAELDQFGKEKSSGTSGLGLGLNISNVGPRDLDLMDDFLEMEKLASMSAAHGGAHDSSGPPLMGSVGPTKPEVDSLSERVKGLEEEVERLKSEKSELEKALAEAEERVEVLRMQLLEAENELTSLRAQLGSANELRQAAKLELEVAGARRSEAEERLEALNKEIGELYERVDSLELRLEEERVFSAGVEAKCRQLEEELKKRNRDAELSTLVSSNGSLKMKQEKELAVAAGKLAECQKTIASLGRQLKALATVDDFMFDAGKPEFSNVDPKLPSNNGSSDQPIINDGESPPSSSSSSSSANDSSEKTRNGFGRLFSRNRSGPRNEKS